METVHTDSPAQSCTLAQKNVRSPLPRKALHAFVAQRRHIDVNQEMLTGTKQNRSHREVQLIDQAGSEILANSRYTASQAHVAITRCSARLLQGGVHAFGDEVKLGTPRHPEGGSRVMREHEHRGVIRRFIAPPALPAIVWPRASYRPEHVTP